ncbi:phosphatidate cytidylyltransferase [Treponema sp. R80B11-R83G3]
MKKIIERLLIFIIGLPAVFTLVILLPYYNNLALNIVTVFFSAMGAVEFSSMLEKKKIVISKIESFILGTVIPLTFTLVISLKITPLIVPIIAMVSAGWVLLSKVFSRTSEIETITGQIIGKFSLLVYPGLFICWMVIMSAWGKPSAILLFLFITFINDSTAWLCGNLFGAKNRGIIPVSPNKSVAGFIGGTLGSIIIAEGAVIFFPQIFIYLNFEISFSYLAIMAAVLGLCTGIAASLGDLAESAIKRSCDFKDSGNFMLGRGGVLDSIDSIAVAAPVFFLLFSMFFRF